MAIAYADWLTKNPTARGVVSEDIYNQALDIYGKMPSATLAPDGSVFWGSDVAKQLGLPTGTFLSTAGTAHARPTTRSGGQGSGSVYVTGDMMDAARQQGVRTAGVGAGANIGDLYSRAGVLDAFGSQDPNDYQLHQNTTAPSTPLPLRSRSNPAQSPGLTPNQQTIGDFMSWWRGEGPNMEGPLGDVYGIKQPWEFSDQYGDWRLMPGHINKYFGDSDNLFAERTQVANLQNGIAPTGPLSPLLPPHFLARYGYGASDVLGGQWGPGQVAASDPSGGSVLNQGAADWWANQTPQGPYAGFQFPNFFGQPGVNAPGNDANGGFNPPDYLNNPGQGGAGGGWTPTPGGGAGGTNGGGTFNPNPFPPVGGTGGTGGGGGSGGGAGATLPPPPTTPPPPNYGTGTATPPSTGVGGGSFQPPAMQSDASAWLANIAPDYGYLQQFASESGMPTDVLPAWDAMVAAQQRNIDRKFADLQEAFNVTGNRFSTPFGQAAVDYQTQAALDQNSLLAQMALGSMESGRNRQFSAANQLANLAYGGISQLSGQDFQSAMNQMNQSYNLANQMYGGSVQGANALQNAAMQAAMGLYGNETGAGMTEVQRQLGLLGLGLDQANTLSNLWQRNLGTGLQLGMGQYSIGQDQIDRVFNEWLRTRNYNNPMLPYMWAAASGYPPAFPQQQNSGLLQSLLGMSGSILGGYLGGLGGG